MEETTDKIQEMKTCMFCCGMKPSFSSTESAILLNFRITDHPRPEIGPLIWPWYGFSASNLLSKARKRAAYLLSQLLQGTHCARRRFLTEESRLALNRFMPAGIGRKSDISESFCNLLWSVFESKAEATTCRASFP